MFPLKVNLFIFSTVVIFVGLLSLLADNNYVILVQVAALLNSTECFVLQSGSTVFTWHGNQCSLEQQQLAAKVAEFLRVALLYFLLTFLICSFLFCRSFYPLRSCTSPILCIYKKSFWTKGCSTELFKNNHKLNHSQVVTILYESNTKFLVSGNWDRFTFQGRTLLTRKLRKFVEMAFIFLLLNIVLTFI